MSDLTEKWKNGELKDGWYYVETNEPFKPSKVIILEYYRTSFESDIDSNYIYKIIAPVPSYETYLTMKDCAKMVFEASERETNLKELLKECRDVAEFAKTIVNKHKWFDEVITKIDEVLE